MLFRPRLARICLRRESTMRSIVFLAAFMVFLLAGETPAISQAQPRNQPPPPAKPAPYKIVAIKPPQPINDAALEALRKQIGEAAQKKDRAALAKLVVAQGSSGSAKMAIVPTRTKPVRTISAWRL